MTKNYKGGNKGKRQARKHQSEGFQKSTRFAQEEGEIYAAVTRLYGGSHCEVKCTDGEHRLCIIRNKFKGRGKRDNTLITGAWVLIGRRAWQTSNEERKEKCDLLEVYSTSDRNQLKEKETKINFSLLGGMGYDKDSEGDENAVEFGDPDTEHYENLKQRDETRIFWDDSEEEIDIETI